MHTNSDCDLDSKETLRRCTLNIGICLFIFQLEKHKFGELKSDSIVIMLTDRKPKIPGKCFNVFTLGLKRISYRKSIRIGIFKSKQILEKI